MHAVILLIELIAGWHNFHLRNCEKLIIQWEKCHNNDDRPIAQFSSTYSLCASQKSIVFFFFLLSSFIIFHRKRAHHLKIPYLYCLLMISWTVYNNNNNRSMWPFNSFNQFNNGNSFEMRWKNCLMFNRETVNAYSIAFTY